MAPCVKSWQNIWQIWQRLIPNTTRWKGISQREIWNSKTNNYLWVLFRQPAYIFVLHILSSALPDNFYAPILKHKMREQLRCLFPAQYWQSDSPSENTPSHPRSTQCSCEEVKVHIKEQITFLNQSNDFIHTGHVCYGVSHQSPAFKRTQTLTMKNTFLRGNSGFLFFFFFFDSLPKNCAAASPCYTLPPTGQSTAGR